MGGRPGRGGSRCAPPLPPPRDLWQVSAARFPDRSSGLEFIWVTATGVVCCDKRRMGRAPRGAWGAVSEGRPARAAEGQEPGCTPCHRPAAVPRRAAPALSPGGWGGAGGVFCHGTPPSTTSALLRLRPRAAALTLLTCPYPGHGERLPLGQQLWHPPAPPPQGAGPDPPGHQSSGGGGCAERRAERKNVPFGSVLLMHVPI